MPPEDSLTEEIRRAFSAIVEAELLIYAAGIGELKEDIILAHTIMLRLRNNYAAMLK